jgi:DNA-binding NarL/FixJ family response regulator
VASLLLVDDHPAFSATLVRFLSIYKDLSVAAVAPSAEAAVEALRHTTVDLVLVDVSLPGTSGIDLVAALRPEYPDLKCLMLSGHREAEYVTRALAAGAQGYVIKGDAPAIVAAIRYVLDGKRYLSPELEGKV